MGETHPRPLIGLLGLSALLTAAGVGVAYQLELVLLPRTPSSRQLILVGFIEEAFVRLVPLIATFYIWSYVRGHLLSKTEGLLVAVLSGVVVAGLELVFKLQYLAQFEMAAHFDALVLPILFVHLPFALVAGRFAYAVGERIHGTEIISRPSFSRQTLALLVAGYLLLTIGHILYNLLI
ncbi:hypothetical protein QA599_11940 [Haloarculaceae archaeon H-GB1-1]|nr:hypothetical protein [Haloarculaceae archaeon H-GB1-1]